MKLDRKQLAALFSVTPRTISEWSTDAEFPKPTKQGRSNLYDAPGVVRWWRDREIARLVEGEDGRLLDLDQERARLAQAQRQRVDLDLQIRRRELVDAESLRRGLRGAWRSVRDGILSVPDRVAAILAAETDAEKVRLTLDGELRQALTHLADDRHELVAQAERGDSERGGDNG